MTKQVQLKSQTSRPKRSTAAKTKKQIEKIPKPKVKVSKKFDIDKIDEGISRDKLEDYMAQIHDIFRKMNSKNPSTANRAQEYILEKTCEKCDNIHCDELLLLCDFCDDAYHTFCLDPPLKSVPPEDEDWMCPVCTEQKRLHDLKEHQEKEEKSGSAQKKASVQRQTILDEHFKIRETKEKTCHKCLEAIDEVLMIEDIPNMEKHKPANNRTMEICIKCQKHYHPHCFNSKKSTIICNFCEKDVKETLPKNDKTLLDFFKVRVGKMAMKIEKEGEVLKERLSSPLKAKTKKKKITVSRRRDIFKLPVPSSDPEKTKKQKMSLAFGLLSKNIEFDDDLCFSNPLCGPACNDTSKEFNLQKMDKDNIIIFKAFKEMTRQGNYAPVIVEEDKLQGFVVRADEDIPRLTLIAEYVGEVDFARNRIFDKNDSIMDLLRTPHSSTSLVICPEKKGNLARFLSGINNYKKNAKRSIQNVKSIRYDIEGHARVLLYADKNIKKGDLLYYDYNEGGFDEYPTQDFV